MTTFEKCVEAAQDVMDNTDGAWGPMDLVTRAVLTALLENTGSPRTVDELTRVLGEG